MSMIKTVGPAGGLEEAHTYQVKLAEHCARGGRLLFGYDLRDFVKRAGHRLADAVRNMEARPGEAVVHQISVGATEWWNVNRNGDGFRDATCKKFHPTFKKYARFYRNHQAKDPRISYGVVRESLYNPDMHRIELIVGLNATKQAADRNGGLVAEKEMEKLASKKDIPVSMSCRISLDVCSVCGNKARNRREYCTEDTCPGGGLAKNMGKLLKSGHILHADNPEPCFFDISHVVRPADRTAFTTGLLSDLPDTPASQKKAASSSVGDEKESLAQRLGRLSLVKAASSRLPLW